jgi:hypothetical protein
MTLKLEYQIKRVIYVLCYKCDHSENKKGLHFCNPLFYWWEQQGSNL